MAGGRRDRSVQSSLGQRLKRKTTIRRGSPCTKVPEEVKSTKSHIYSPPMAELEGGTLSKFVDLLTILEKETLTMLVQAMNPQLIVKICEEAEPYVLADFVECLGSSLMYNFLQVLHENDAYNNMSEDKLHNLLFILEAYGYLHKIFKSLQDDVLVKLGNYVVNKDANDNINKSSKSKYGPIARFLKGKICTNSSASSALGALPALGVLPLSWMNSEGESYDMHPKPLEQEVVCPVALMNSDGESCHNYLRSQQQLHAVVKLNYKVESCGKHVEMHISIDNVRCRVLSYPSCSGHLAKSYYVCGIKIKVEPQPSDSFHDEIPQLKLQTSTPDDSKTLSTGTESSFTVNLPKLSIGLGTKATQSITKNEVQWTYGQFDGGNNIGGMEWTYNSSFIGGDVVFSDNKYPESLLWRIKQDITKPKTLRWCIRTHFYLKSSHDRNHIISHEVERRFNSTL